MFRRHNVEITSTTQPNVFTAYGHQCYKDLDICFVGTTLKARRQPNPTSLQRMVINVIRTWIYVSSAQR